MNGSTPNALHVVFVLFQELLYMMQDGGPAGEFTLAERGRIETAISEATELKENILEKLRDSGWLKADGDRFLCPRFQALHAGASLTRQHMSRQGGNMRAFKHNMEIANSKAIQTSLSIAEYKFVDENGAQLSAEETQRITRLIMACDSALFRRTERPLMYYTEGLIQDALKVVRSTADENIDYVLRKVALHRDHPALIGFTTEKLLPKFKSIIGDLGSE